MPKTHSKLLIVVPAYNETGNIVAMLNELKLSGFVADVLVVNDASVDTTAAEAKNMGVKVVSLPFNLGIGGAVQTGLLYAKRKGYEVAFQVDADGQHDPQFLKDLLAPILSNKADLVIGSRFLPPHLGYQSSMIRRVGINFFATVISVLIGSKITDPTSGFRAFNRKSIELYAAEYPHDYPEPEAIVLASLSGLKIREVPVQMRKRVGGVSSIRYLKTLYYMIKVTLAILLDMLKERKGKSS